MKSTLYLKFIFIYIIFGFLSLFTAATLTENLVRTPIFNRVSNSMYREATMVATSYLPGYFSGELQESDTQMILSGIDFVPIAKEKLVVVVPRDHELAGRGSVDLKETLPYLQVYFTKNSGLRPVIDQLFEQTGGTPKIAYEILEDASMAGLVAENFGIAVMPEIPILKNLNVDVLDIENPPYERYIYLAKLKEKYLAPVVKEFIEYVKESNGKAL